MKRRWKILIALGLFLVFVAASLMMSTHVQPQNQLEAYKKLLRDQGEKLELREVLPPMPAPEDNSAGAVRDAFRLFTPGNELVPNTRCMVAPGRAMVGWLQPDARSSDFTNSWDDFGSYVEANRPAIDQLHQALDRPKLDFELDYKMGARMSIPHLGTLKRAAQKLEAAVVYDLHRGDTGTATTNILTLLALIHHNADEGLLISHLVRIAVTQVAVLPAWELLQATNFTDPQLAALQHGWQEMDFLSDAENVFVFERAWIMMEIEALRASHERFGALLGSSATSSGGSSWSDMLEDATRGARTTVGEAMWRSSWSYTDELRLLQTDQLVLEAVRTMRTNRTQFYQADYEALNSRLTSLGFTNTSEAIFRTLKIPDFHEEFGEYGFLNSTIRKTLQAEATCHIVITAIGLKRFQVKYGQLPETLAKLTPEFLPSVPVDIYDGKPLKYHPNPDGTVLLYCVGPDGLDDGGDAGPTRSASTTPPNWNWQHTRDWVWPQPASPAEVQDFYEHPTK